MTFAVYMQQCTPTHFFNTTEILIVLVATSASCHSVPGYRHYILLYTSICLLNSLFFGVETYNPSTLQTSLVSYCVSQSSSHRYYAVDFKIGEHAVTIRQSEPLLCIDRQWGGTRLAVEGM